MSEPTRNHRMSKRGLSIILLFLLIASCGNMSETSKTNNKKEHKSENISGNFADGETTRSRTINYEFLQSKNTEKAKEILIVVIDPHGDGKLAVSKFNKITESFDCTIIGLNDVKNNQSGFIQKIEADVKTAKSELNLNVKYFFIAGFSGGARMAFQYALSHKVNGVLMCGAGINLQKAGNLNFPLAMITGTKDFNFIEQYYSPYSPIVKNKNILTLVFEGIHEWPPEDDINTAISFLLSKNKLSSLKENKFTEKADNLLKEKDYFKAFKMYEAAYKTNDKSAEMKLNNLLKNNKFKTFINQYEVSLQKEAERNKTYIGYLTTKNLSWWHDEIFRINKLTKSKDKLEAASFSRSKAYLGIAMYSSVNKEIANPWSKNVDKFLKIYEYLEPENPDMWFYNSVREKQKNNSALSEKYLKRAFAFGFKDSIKAKQYGLISEKLSDE
ncbi:MAG: hypothetical protein L3J56_01590 [Bacteroidales bacterium]|nr:hypothetical protein [Bacteroidales bacterium]